MKFSTLGLSQIKKIFSTAKANGELLGRSLEDAYMTDLLQAAINDGVIINSLPVEGGWVEVDTVDDMKSAVTSDRLKMI